MGVRVSPGVPNLQRGYMRLSNLPIDYCGLITDVQYTDDNIDLIYSAMRLGVVPGLEIRKISETKTVSEFRSMDEGWTVALSKNITDYFIVDLLRDDAEY